MTSSTNDLLDVESLQWSCVVTTEAISAVFRFAAGLDLFLSIIQDDIGLSDFPACAAACLSFFLPPAAVAIFDGFVSYSVDFWQ